MGVEPWFNETWGVCPSLLPVYRQRELRELGVACVRALGFSSGVFHVECKYTSTGPQLIEVNARMGGGPVHEANLRVWGVDLVEEAIFIALGIPARPFAPEAPMEPVANYFVPAARSGVVRAKLLCKRGDRVTGPDDGMPTWTLDLMVRGSDAQEALDLIFRLEEQFRVEIE